MVYFYEEKKVRQFLLCTYATPFPLLLPLTWSFKLPTENTAALQALKGKKKQGQTNLFSSALLLESAELLKSIF